MAESSKNASSADRMAASQSTRDYPPRSDSQSWEGLDPVHVDYEDTMNPLKVARVWTEIYNAAGLRSASEKEQRSVRCAVYVYGAKNGTSREGDYLGSITTGLGLTFSASIIPVATGKFGIRKFFRANANESYDYFTRSDILVNDRKYVQKAERLGIPRDDAFCMADWLGDCSRMSQHQQRMHEKSFVNATTKAAAVRGSNLETVEKERNDAVIESQKVASPPVQGRSVF